MLQETKRSTIKKMPEKGVKDKAILCEIIDESLLAHIAIMGEDCPMVIPMSAWRIDDHIYIHGAKNSRLMKSLAQGQTCSLAFTLFDGWVLARSAYNHGAHYRSAVVFGQFDVVEGAQQKSDVLDAFIDCIAAGRSALVRSGSASELSATTVLKMPLTEASIKVSDGGVDDLASDKHSEVWAGVLPYKTVVGPLITDSEVPEDTELPDYSEQYQDRWHQE